LGLTKGTKDIIEIKYSAKVKGKQNKKRKELNNKRAMLY
jgi:hypothetical protein